MRLTLPAHCFFALLSGISAAQGIDHSPLSQRNNDLPMHPLPPVVSWTAPKVQHAYGLPEFKPSAKGTLSVNQSGMTFTSKAGRYTIPWDSATALNNGSERVELWGTTGRLVRMVIPNGGGLAAAGVMHHKIFELTIEFKDGRGAYRAAVFLLPEKDANHVLESFSQTRPFVKKETPVSNELSSGISPDTTGCQSKADATNNVLVASPSWTQSEVPAAYRALVYEHIIDRLQHVKGVGHVYRAGEHGASPVCAEYTVNLAVISFKAGSQVKRATLGPIGLFAGTTQMTFNMIITDATGKVRAEEQIKATVRGDAQSQSVATAVAKKMAKAYATVMKQNMKLTPAHA